MIILQESIIKIHNIEIDFYPSDVKESIIQFFLIGY